ncbi:ATP-dependent RNA helicase RhlE [Glycocaulis alkaliphilus]|uniref:ATP-dependent RNA helicase RhlE n=2 Tax=Glycocaulis alkaliphilus TaxID=1434191 RepID=A0A3T0EBG2_9PROT|nr:ATP-dependent RNA helicase RhlE [Glycocaulis alkaliphilus]
MKGIDMTKFTELGLAAPVERAVVDEGYETPTPIQVRAIPPLLQGKDVVGIAQTGTGKTAAFVLPILTRLLAEKKQAPGLSCRCLILAPTRELAAQIGDSIAVYGRHTGLTHAVVFGGVKHGPQVRALARGLDILVATPGRLLDHVADRKARLDLTSLVVLDEADQMLDLGFMPALRKILHMVGKPRQTVMFSATMPPPIRALADDFLHDPVTVAVANQSKPVERIEQAVMYVGTAEKRQALIDLMAPEANKSTIIFTRTKRGADKVAKFLAEYGHKAAAIHGNKSQNQREKALAAFKSGEMRVLVATDIAARGLDIDGVELVVNFELPNVPESYVHRIGRTARAGAQGRAVALVAPDERGLLQDVEKLTGLRIKGLNDAPPISGPTRPVQPQRGPRRGGGHGGGQGGNRQGGQRGQQNNGGGGQKRSGNRRRKPGGGQRQSA